MRTAKDNYVFFWLEPSVQLGTVPGNCHLCLLLCIGPFMFKPFFRPFWWYWPKADGRWEPHLKTLWLQAGPFYCILQWARKQREAPCV